MFLNVFFFKAIMICFFFRFVLIRVSILIRLFLILFFVLGNCWYFFEERIYRGGKSGCLKG